MSIRTERVARLMQRELADILGREYGDQLPAMVTITDTRVTRDLSILYVYVSVMTEEAGSRDAAFGHLQSLTPRIRSTLAGRIRHQVRKVPEIRRSRNFAERGISWVQARLVA